MRVLVTGGAGFVGSNLCSKLLEQGHQVTCLDNFFTSHRNNVASFLLHESFTLIEQDIIFSQPVDMIFHLACPAAPDHYQADPIHTIRTAFLGTYNCLEFARIHKSRILIASTSEVYGEPLVHPQTEEYWGNVNPIGPRSCYDEGKRAAETLAFDYYRKYQVDVTLVRIFNTYGPMMHPFDGRVVSNFIQQCLKDEPITIYGDGSQTRSFQYIDDLLQAFFKIMKANSFFVGPINLGNPYELSILQLAHLVKNLTGSNSTINHLPKTVDDPTQRKPVIEKANSLLDWKPTVSLSEGIIPTIEYFKQLDISLYTSPTQHMREMVSSS